MTPAGLPHSGIDGALPACGPPSLFAACHALHRPVSPRHPPHTGSCLGETASRPRPCPAAAREPPLATARHHVTYPASPGQAETQRTLPSLDVAKAVRTSLRPVLKTSSHLHLLTSPPTTGPDVPSTEVAAGAASCAAPTRAGRWPWVFLDSNQRPLPYQGSALTT